MHAQPGLNLTPSRGLSDAASSPSPNLVLALRAGFFYIRRQAASDTINQSDALERANSPKAQAEGLSVGRPNPHPTGKMRRPIPACELPSDLSACAGGKGGIAQTSNRQARAMMGRRQVRHRYNKDKIKERGRCAARVGKTMNDNPYRRAAFTRGSNQFKASWWDSGFKEVMREKEAARGGHE